MPTPPRLAALAAALMILWAAPSSARAEDVAGSTPTAVEISTPPPAAVDGSTPTPVAVDSSTPTPAVVDGSTPTPAAADSSTPAPAPTVASGRKDLWVLNVAAGVSRPIGSGKVAAAGGAGPSLGVETSYGFSNEWAIGASYDYLNLRDAIRVQPLDLEIIRVLRPAARCSLIAKAGAGAAKLSGYPDSTGDFTKVSYKLGTGLRYAFDDTLAFEATVDYHYIPVTGYGDNIHALNFSVAAGYRFLPAKPAAP